MQNTKQMVDHGLFPENEHSEIHFKKSCHFKINWNQGIYSLRKHRLISIGIPIINLRRSAVYNGDSYASKTKPFEWIEALVCCPASWLNMFAILNWYFVACNFVSFSRIEAYQFSGRLTCLYVLRLTDFQHISTDTCLSHTISKHNVDWNEITIIWGFALKRLLANSPAYMVVMSLFY